MINQQEKDLIRSLYAARAILALERGALLEKYHCDVVNDSEWYELERKEMYLNLLLGSVVRTQQPSTAHATLEATDVLPPATIQLVLGGVSIATVTSTSNDTIAKILSFFAKEVNTYLDNTLMVLGRAYVKDNTIKVVGDFQNDTTFEVSIEIDPAYTGTDSIGVKEFSHFCGFMKVGQIASHCGDNTQLEKIYHDLVSAVLRSDCCQAQITVSPLGGYCEEHNGASGITVGGSSGSGGTGSETGGGSGGSGTDPDIVATLVLTSEGDALVPKVTQAGQFQNQFSWSFEINFSGNEIQSYSESGDQNNLPPLFPLFFGMSNAVTLVLNTANDSLVFTITNNSQLFAVNYLWELTIYDAQGNIPQGNIFTGDQDDMPGTLEKIGEQALKLVPDNDPIDPLPPSAPTISVSSPSPGEAEVSWTNVEYHTYEVYRDGVFVTVAPGGMHTESGLIPGNTYAYYVQAVDRYGRSDESSISNSVNITV